MQSTFILGKKDEAKTESVKDVSKANKKLQKAIADNHFESVQRAVAIGADINNPNFTFLISTISMFMADKNAFDYRILKFLLEMGGNPNRPNRLGVTPLLHAGCNKYLSALNDHFNIIELLIRYEGDYEISIPEIKENITPLRSYGFDDKAIGKNTREWLSDEKSKEKFDKMLERIRKFPHAAVKWSYEPSIKSKLIANAIKEPHWCLSVLKEEVINTVNIRIDNKTNRNRPQAELIQDFFQYVSEEYGEEIFAYNMYANDITRLTISFTDNEDNRKVFLLVTEKFFEAIFEKSVPMDQQLEDDFHKTEKQWVEALCKEGMLIQTYREKQIQRQHIIATTLLEDNLIHNDLAQIVLEYSGVEKSAVKALPKQSMFSQSSAPSGVVVKNNQKTDNSSCCIL